MSKPSLYSPTLDGTSVSLKRREIKEYFLNTYSLYEKVFEVLKDDEVFYKKSEITRHPMIFYFGHTATFFINKLINMQIIDERINPDFESIFAVGVDEMDWDDMQSPSDSWPKVSEVRAYRVAVKELVLRLIETLPLSLPISDDSPMWIIMMGIGIVIMIYSRDDFSVQISSNSGESNALISKDKIYVQKIVDAVNEAIIHRG